MKTAAVLTLSHRYERLLAALSVLEEEAMSTRQALEQEVNFIKAELGLFLAEPEVEAWWEHFENIQGITITAAVLLRLTNSNIHWACFMKNYERIGKSDPAHALAALELAPKPFPGASGDPSLN